MEVALPTLFRLFTLLPLFTLPSQFKLLKQWHVCLYIVRNGWNANWRYGMTRFQATSGMGDWMEWSVYPLDCYDY